MDRACLEYGVRAGLIFCLAREFSLELNEILVEEGGQVQGARRGGDRSGRPRVAHAGAGRRGGAATAICSRGRAPPALGTTVHTGETAHTAAPGVLAVLKELEPARIGHGIAAAASEEAIRKLAETGTVLEICPSSNLRTRAVASLDELGAVLRTFENAGVRYTINTDGPYLLNTHLRLEYEMLLDNKILSEAEVERSVAVSRAASFVR